MNKKSKKFFDQIFLGILCCISGFIYCKIFGVDYDKLSPLFKVLPFFGSVGLYIVLAPILALLSPIYSTRVIKTKWGLSQEHIDPASKFIGSVQDSRGEYALILRPFGNDAFFSVNNITSEFYFNSIISNWSKEIVMEQVVESTLLKYGLKDTVALVDPRLNSVPTTPKFISATNETWQYVVFDLLKRALYVFVILPPKIKISNALIWEITKMIQMGLIGRFAIILPPQPLAENRRTLAEIKKKLYFISDSMEVLDDATCIIYPNERNSVDYYYNSWYKLPPKERKKHMEVLPLKTYAEFMDNLVAKMQQVTANLSFGERYLYRSRVYEEDDHIFSPQYLEMFLKNRRGPFR